MSPISVVNFGVVIGMSTCKKRDLANLNVCNSLLTFTCMNVLFGFFYGIRNCFGIMKSNSRSLMVCVKPRWFDTPSLMVHSDVPKVDGVLMFSPNAWWFFKRIAKEKKKVFLIQNSLVLTSASKNLY